MQCFSFFENGELNEGSGQVALPMEGSTGARFREAIRETVALSRDQISRMYCIMVNFGTIWTLRLVMFYVIPA